MLRICISSLKNAAPLATNKIPLVGWFYYGGQYSARGKTFLALVRDIYTAFVNTDCVTEFILVPLI